MPGPVSTQLSMNIPFGPVLAPDNNLFRDPPMFGLLATKEWWEEEKAGVPWRPGL